MEDKKIVEMLTETQIITRHVLKVMAAIAVAVASFWVYLGAFGVIDEPSEKVQEIAAKADSIVITETTIDSLNISDATK